LNRAVLVKMSEEKHHLLDSSSLEIVRKYEIDDVDDELPSNAMEELLFRELAVLKLGIGRDQKIPISLRYLEKSGRGMIATRNIKKGEIIVEESPVVWGPKATSTGASCLECSQHLHDLPDVTFCSLCHLHFCSPECSQSPYHKQECSEMQKLNIKTDSMERLGKLTLVIVTLRCLLLPETAPQNWARLRLLQDHLNSGQNTKLHQMNQEFLVRFLREIGLNEAIINDFEIHTVCGILESNAFEVKSVDELESRAVFPLCSMANSSCIPNMTHITKTDKKMVMLATRDIMKGQELFICYTGTRWGRTARRAHLLLTKCFLCCCQRCLDPTECGTYISALKCPECGGNMVQEMEDGSSEVDNIWGCNSCNHKMDHKKVIATEAMIGQILKIINKKSPQHLEGVSRKLKQWLSPTHYILQEIQMSLIALYQQKNEKPERIVELCNILLPVLYKLEGESKAAAILKISKIAAQVKLYQDGNEESLEADWWREAIIDFQVSSSLLSYDVQAPANLEETRIVLENIQERTQ